MQVFGFIYFTICLVTFSSSQFTDISNINTILSCDLRYSDVVFEEQRINLIYPGTKWCGPGNVAVGYDDLGTSQAADKCCREHDLCPDLIESGNTKHNLKNNAYYTRLNCNCDEKFRQCLRDANTKTSNQIGVVYFNIIKTKCYRHDYPVTGCKKKGGTFLIRKCVEHTYNTNEKKRYQWFDVPDYR